VINRTPDPELLCGQSRHPRLAERDAPSGPWPLAPDPPFDADDVDDVHAGSGAVGTASASLDADESTSPPPRNLYHTFRHSGWARQRSAVKAALDLLAGLRPANNEETPKPSTTTLTHTPPPARHDQNETLPEPAHNPKSGPWSSAARDRFDSCGTSGWVLQSNDEPPRYRVAVNRCRHRFCLPCARERGLLVSSNLREKLPKVPLRFITLTVKARDASLRDALDHLYGSFARLRRSKTWREHVKGGLAVAEVTWRPEKGRWHPHLHLIVQGSYFPQDTLRRAWLKATGDSFIVDIRAVRSLDEAARYLTAYLTKSLCKRVWRDQHRLCEAIQALHGRKLISCFGTWSRLKLLEPISSDAEWHVVCSADRLLERVRAGEPASCKLAVVLWRRSLVDWLQEKPP